MPNVPLPGGTTLYTGATNSAAVPFIQTGVSIPAGRVMSNGSTDILVHRIRAFAGGYSGSITCSLQLGSVKTSNFSMPAGTASSTSWRNINVLLSPGTATFRLNASARAYIGRSNGGSPQLQDDAGNTWSGQAVGEYSYYEAPSVPLAFTATATGFTTAEVSWQAPNSSGGTPITGYHLQVATNPLFFSASSYQNVGLSRSLTGLNPGTTYYVRVGAKNAVTEEATAGVTVTGVYAPTITFTTDAYSPPSAPTSVMVASSTPTSATITWNPPLYDGGTPVTSYDLRYSTDPTFTTFTLLTGVTSPRVVSPLTSGTTVYFQARALNAQGPGVWSAAAEVELTGAPSAPPSLVVTSALATTIGISWGIPVDDGGEPITGYRIQRSLSPSFTSPTTIDVGTTPRTYQFTGLDANTTYYIRVAGRNAATDLGAAFKWSSTSATTVGVVNFLQSSAWVPHRGRVLRSGAWVDLIPHSLNGGAWNPPA